MAQQIDMNTIDVAAISNTVVYEFVPRSNLGRLKDEFNDDLVNVVVKQYKNGALISLRDFDNSAFFIETKAELFKLMSKIGIYENNPVSPFGEDYNFDNVECRL